MVSRSGEFRDAVAVVTGGAGGIGSGVVTALKSAQATVVSLDLVKNTSADISVECDVTDERSMTEAIDRAVAKTGALHHIVSSAGVVHETPFESLQTEQWRKIIDVSLTSTFFALRAAIPHMLKAGRGSIVTMSSGFGRKGYPSGSDYAAAKSGIEALTKSIALEYASRGIRANSIAPGPIRTAMIRDNPGFDEEAKAKIIPMGRVGEVEEVVPAILFLLSNEASYITGQVLHVNGGLLMP